MTRVRVPRKEEWAWCAARLRRSFARPGLPKRKRPRRAACCSQSECLRLPVVLKCESCKQQQRCELSLWFCVFEYCCVRVCKLQHCCKGHLSCLLFVKTRLASRQTPSAFGTSEVNLCVRQNLMLSEQRGIALAQAFVVPFLSGPLWWQNDF